MKQNFFLLPLLAAALLSLASCGEVLKSLGIGGTTETTTIDTLPPQPTTTLKPVAHSAPPPSGQKTANTHGIEDADEPVKSGVDTTIANNPKTTAPPPPPSGISAEQLMKSQTGHYIQLGAAPEGAADETARQALWNASGKFGAEDLLFFKEGDRWKSLWAPNRQAFLTNDAAAKGFKGLAKKYRNPFGALNTPKGPFVKTVEPGQFTPESLWVYDAQLGVFHRLIPDKNAGKKKKRWNRTNLEAPDCIRRQGPLVLQGFVISGNAGNLFHHALVPDFSLRSK